MTSEPRPVGGRRPRLMWGLVAVLAVTALNGLGIGLSGWPASGAADTSPGPAAATAMDPERPATQAAPGDGYAALDGITGPPTLYGEVTDVPDPATAVVEVEGRPITVSVIGVNGDVPSCAMDDATAFARDMLDGQTVTLVPDPTLPTDPAAPTWPAYLVLPSQQSYTDAAIRAGWVEPGQGRYRPGFLIQQEQAQDEGAGMWGPPCDLTPPP